MEKVCVHVTSVLGLTLTVNRKAGWTFTLAILTVHFYICAH